MATSSSSPFPSTSSSPSSSPSVPRAISRESVAQDVEAELRIVCVESRKKYSQIKEHSERVIAKLIASNGNVPVEEVLAVVIVASETHNPKLVLPCLGCVQRLIMGQLVNTSKLLGTVVTYLHDRAKDSDPTVQVKALQTILLLLTPSFAPLLTGSEMLMEQLLSACVILLGSDSGLVRHTAVACLRQVADFLIDEAGKAYHNLTPDALESLGAGNDDNRSGRKGPSGSLMVEAMPVPDRLPSGPLRLLFLFVHDLCLISMGRASRGKWLGELAISRTLALELIESALAAQADVFACLPDFTELTRQVVVPTVESTIAVCQYDFKVLIRALRIVYRLCSYPPLCAKLSREICGESPAPGEHSGHGPVRGLVPLMLRQLLLRHDRPLWARSAVLETFRKILQSGDAAAANGFLNTLFLGSSNSVFTSSPLNDDILESDDNNSSSSPTTATQVLTDPKSNRFVELVNSLSHVLHHLWFASVPTQSTEDISETAVYDELDTNTATSGSDLLTLGVSRIFAGEGRVSLLDCLADSDAPSFVNPSFGAALAADTILLLVDHISTCAMLACSWAPLLSSLSLLLSVRLPKANVQSSGSGMLTDDEEAFDVFLQGVLTALERLLLGCAKFPQLSSGRDSCLEALAKESLPRRGARELDSHTAACAKGFLNICHRSGEQLSVPGWSLALRTFETLYLRFISPEQQAVSANSDSALECQMLAVSMDSLFSTAPESDGSFVDMVNALVHLDTCWSIQRLAMALSSADSRRLSLVLDSIVTPSLKGSTHPEEAAICIGKVVTTHICRPGCSTSSLIAPLKAFTTSAPETVVSILKDVMVHSPVSSKLDEAGWVSLSELVRDLCDVPTVVATNQANASAGKRSSRLMSNQLHLSVYSLLEVLVVECIDALPNASVSLIVDGLQRLCTNSVVNTSLKALGLLWNVSDALMGRMSGKVSNADQSRRHNSTGSDGTPTVEPIVCDPEESAHLWFDLLTKFKSVSLDPRPPVRHCAIRTMVSMLNAACGCPQVDSAAAVGVMCDTLSEVVEASMAASSVDTPPLEDSPGYARGSSSEGLIVHHSRDSIQKQWNETCVLALEGSVSIASRYHSYMTEDQFDRPTQAILDFIRPRLVGRDGEVHGACANALVELLRLGAVEKDDKLWSEGWQLVAYVADSLVEEPILTEEASVLLPISLAELVKDPQCLQAFRADDVIVLALLVMATVTRPSIYLQSALPFKDIWVPTTLTNRHIKAVSAGSTVSQGLCEVTSPGRCAELLWGKTSDSSSSMTTRYRRLPEVVKSPLVEARDRGDGYDECHQPAVADGIVFSRTVQRLPHKFMELWSVVDLLATSTVPEDSLEVLVRLLCNGFLDINYCLRDSLTAALAVRAATTCELIAQKLPASAEVKASILEMMTSTAMDLMRTYYAGGTGGGQSWKASGFWQLSCEIMSTSLDQLRLMTIPDTTEGFWSDCISELCKSFPAVLRVHFRYYQPPQQRPVSSPVATKDAVDWATTSAVAILIALCRSHFADPTKVVELTSTLCDTRGSGDLGRCALRVLFAVASQSGILWSKEDMKSSSMKVAERWVGYRYSGGDHQPSSPVADSVARDNGMDISPQLRKLGTSELCRRVSCTLSQYAEDDKTTTIERPMPRHRTEQVLFVLGRLCESTDRQLLLATLPALSRIVASGRDDDVRQAASNVLLCLADILGSKAAYKDIVGTEFV